jgi:hypothetical protein
MGLREQLWLLSALSFEEYRQAHLKEVTEESETSNQRNW